MLKRKRAHAIISINIEKLREFFRFLSTNGQKT